MKKLAFQSIAYLLFAGLALLSSASLSVFAAQAPEFSVPNQDGKVVHFSDFKGKFVLLYFYPKDDTPGCTKEACSFRDEFAEFKKIDAVVLGVSGQDQKSHQKFKAKHRLPFDLLVDSEGELAKKFEIGTMPVLGWTKRKSILISPEGEILKAYNDVEPKEHAREVLKDIQKFKSK